MHRRPSSLCPASRYKTLVFSLPSLLRLRGGYPASALASGRAVLHAITFYMHRMLSSLYHNSSLGSFFSLPFHLRMRRGYPAQPWFQYKVLVFSLPFHLCMRERVQLCPGSRYKILVFSLPSHLRMRGGFSALPWFQV